MKTGERVCLIYTGLRAGSEKEAWSVVEAVGSQLDLNRDQVLQLLRSRPALIAGPLEPRQADRAARKLKDLGLQLVVLPAAGVSPPKPAPPVPAEEEEALELMTGEAPEMMAPPPGPPPLLEEEPVEWLDEVPGGGLLAEEPEIVTGKDKLDTIMRDLLKTEKPVQEEVTEPLPLDREETKRFWPMILSMREKVGIGERAAILRQMLKMGDAAREVIIQEAALTAEPAVHLLSDPLLQPLAAGLLGRMGEQAAAAMARILIQKCQKREHIEALIELLTPTGTPGVEALGRALRDETERSQELQRVVERLEYENQREMAKLQEAGVETKSKAVVERERKVVELKQEMEAIHHNRLQIVRALGHVHHEVVVLPLIGVLQDPQEKIKTLATKALVAMGPQAVVPLVRELKPAYISTAEADILVEIGAAAAPHLVEAMRHSSWTLEQDVLFRIGRPAVESLLEVLEEADPAIRLKAISVLGRIGDPRAAPRLIELLQDPATPQEHRPRILWALGRMADPRAVEPVIAAMQKPELRSDAIKALHRLGTATVEVVRRMGTAALQPLIEALSDYTLRPIAEEFLVQLGSLAFEPVLAAIEQPPLRKAACEILGLLGDKRAVEVLLPFLHDRDVAIRSATIESLGRLQDERALEPLLAALEDASVAVNAASALGYLGDPRAVPVLIPCLTSKQEELPRQAAEALGNIGSPEAIEPLLKAVGVEHTRWVALVALAKLGEPARQVVRQKGTPMVEALIAHLKRAKTLGHLGRIDGPAVRGAIVDLIVSFGPPALEPLLQEFKKDEGIAEAIGRIRSPDTYQFLMTALISEDPELHKQAAVALGWFGQRAAIPALVLLLETEGRDIESLNIFAESLLLLDAGTAIPELLKLLHSSQRKETVEAITKIMLAQPVVVIPQLLESLKEESQVLTAMVMLEKFGAQAVEPLLATLRGTALPEYKRRLIQALGRIGGERAVQALVQQLSDRDETVVMEAVRILGKSGTREAMQPLLALRERLAREEPVLEQAIQNIRQWGS